MLQNNLRNVATKSPLQQQLFSPQMWKKQFLLTQQRLHHHHYPRNNTTTTAPLTAQRHNINMMKRQATFATTTTTSPPQTTTIHTTSTQSFHSFLRTTRQMQSLQTNARRNYTATTPQRAFMNNQGLFARRAKKSLGTNPEPAKYKHEDPWGIKAREARLQAEIEAMAEGREVDPTAAMSEEEKRRFLAYQQEVQEADRFFYYMDKLVSTPFFYLALYTIPGVSIIGFFWWVGAKVVNWLERDIQKEQIVNNKQERILAAIDDYSLEDSQRYKRELRKQLQMDATAEDIANLARKHKSKEYVEHVATQTSGAVEGLVKNFMYPPAQHWEARKPLIHAYMATNMSYADYVGKGHFHIYYNGTDQVATVLEKIKKDNPGMPFTWQILTPHQVHICLTQGGLEQQKEATLYGLQKGQSIPKNHIKQKKKEEAEAAAAKQAAQDAEKAAAEEAKAKAAAQQQTGPIIPQNADEVIQLLTPDTTKVEEMQKKQEIVAGTISTIYTPEFLEEHKRKQREREATLKQRHDELVRQQQELRRQEEEYRQAELKLIAEQKAMEKKRKRQERKLKLQQQKIKAAEDAANGIVPTTTIDADLLKDEDDDMDIDDEEEKK